MAPKSVVEVACEPLDREIDRLQEIINGLERSKELIRHAHLASISVTQKSGRPKGSRNKAKDVGKFKMDVTERASPAYTDTKTVGTSSS